MLRLGMPFVSLMAFLMPLAHYPTYRLTTSDPSLIPFWRHWMALPF
jgi:hypothetical protein